MTTLSTVMVIQRNGQDLEVEVEGALVPGGYGDRDNPDEETSVEDIVARSTLTATVVALTPDEETCAAEKMLANYEPEPAEWD